MAKLKTLNKTADKLNKQVRKARQRLDNLISEQQKNSAKIRAKHQKLQAKEDAKQERKDAKKAAKNVPSPVIPAPVGGNMSVDMASVAKAVSKNAKQPKGSKKNK